jgi:hypothetical protein
MAFNKNNNETYNYDHNYQQAEEDYSEMGPLWAEIVFPDDFEALKVLYGRRSGQDTPNEQYQSRDEHNKRNR